MTYAVALEPDILAEDMIEQGLFDCSIDLAITRRPLALPNCECVPLMTEHLSLYAPLTSRFAKTSDLSFADIDGETFLVFEQIGFWREVCENALPHATFIFNKDCEVFVQLLESSELLGFTTDAPQNQGYRTHGLSDKRVAIPLRDASAHATFYLVALSDASARIGEVIDWVRAAD